MAGRLGGRRSSGRVLVTLVALAIGVSFLASTMEPAAAVTPGSHGDRIVSEAPISGTPQVLDGYVRGFAEVGNIVLAGGNFSQVRQSGNQPILSRQNIVAFQKSNNQILAGFDPDVNGEVFGILPTGDGQTAWVYGGFSQWNGQNISRIVKINVNTGQRVAAFSPPGFNGRIHDIALRGDRLYVMGRFTVVAGQPHTLVAALDPNTGAVIPEVKIDIAVPRPNRPDGFLTVVAGDVTPDGSKMVIIGNFTQIDGQPRYQIGMLDLTTDPISLADWRTTDYDDSCSGSFDTYMRDVEISKDGEFFVVVTTGAFSGGQPANGAPTGTLCDTAARWDFSQTGEGQTPTWVNYTGGDTLLSVAVTESVAYLGGHQRWHNNPFCSDCNQGRGAVTREGIAAADVVSGSTLSWNPGRSRGVGVYGMLATDTGLWVGSDTNTFNNSTRPRIAFVPLNGGSQMPMEFGGSLPGAVYSVGRDTGTSSQIDQLVRREFDGSDVSSSQVISSPVAWRNMRGAFMVDGNLYYGWEEGGQRSFRVAGFDGQTLGQPRIINLNGLDHNRPTNRGMGLGTIRSPLNIPNFQNFDLLENGMRGMFYDPEAGRLYFTTPQSGWGSNSTANRLSWRQFTTESEIVGAVRNNGPGNMTGLSWQNVRSMFLVDGHLYVADTTGHLTRWDWQSNAGTPLSGTPVPGSGVVVSGPTVDGEDWRARDAFVFVGEGEEPPNIPPIADFTHECDGATCEFDASGSSDPDGTIVTYSWDFDDDTSPGTGKSIGHTYQASGSYDVTLTVTDDDGATTSIQISIAVTVPNLPPTPSFTFVCSALTCDFDASDSTDPTGDPLTYTWDFGDGESDSGVNASHTYTEGGTFEVTLTVSDGVSSPQTSQEVTVVDPSEVEDVEFRAVVSTNVNSRSPSVTVPSSVEAGDVLVLVASMNNESPSVAGPAGWTSLGSAADSTATVQTHAWWKKASAGDAGSVVTVSMTPNGAKTALQLLAYSDADEVSAAVVNIDTVSGTVRTTPSVPVARDGSVLVSYWADKSGGSSGWELPAGVTERDQTIGSGGGLMAAAVADSGPLAAGTGGGLTATSTASANRRGITWSIVIAPVETGASPSNQSPEASFTHSCDELVCEFTSTSSDADGSIVSYLWDFGGGETSTEENPSHVFSASGTYPVSLTVTDDAGATDTAVVDVTVTEGAEPTAQPAFRAVVSTNVNSRSPSVTVPSLVEAGDVLVLVASMNNESPSVAGPAGWTSLGSAADSTATVQTHAWWKKASAGDAGSVVTVSMTPNGAKTALQLLAYSDADEVSAAVVNIDTVSGTVRTTPSVPVARDGSVLVSYWADKSGGSSGWELPAGVTERDQTIGSGGGLMAAAVADSGPLAAGTGGGLTATSTASANRRGITWSIVIAPVN